ncbi:MAG: hypothetical protein JWO38_8174 [Gemmataceae bacterium]|nr:hypothetical protein [Gemmataceae bacterium]
MTSARWIGSGAVAFLVLWLLFLAGGQSSFFRDPGTFWHVATGERILADGFIRTDPYTFTFGGTWWVPYQWLGEVAMALAHRAGGFDTLLLGAVTLVAGVFAWLAVRLLRTGLHPVAVGAVVFFALAASSSHFHVRPHLFTIACMAVTAAVLMDIDAGRAPLRHLAWLVPLFVVWTNVHGGVLGGMATVGLTATGWAIGRGLGFHTPLRTGTDAAWVLGVAVACGLTAFVNPYGLDLIRTWHVIMGEPVLKQIIQEHSPLDPSEPYAWPVLGFAAVYLFLLAGVPGRNLRVSWLLPLVWLALTFSRVRHAPLFAVVGLVGVAAVWPHTRWAKWLERNRPDFYQPPPAPPQTPLWANLWLPALAVAIAFALQVARVPVPVIGAGWARHDPRHWPIELLDVLKEHEPRSPVGNHLFNDYIDGGFMIYHAPGYKVFVDDRCEVFGGEWLLKFVRASSEDTAAAIAGWEAAYGRFDFALTRAGTGFDDYFRQSAAWELVKRTDTAAFYRRK